MAEIKLYPPDGGKIPVIPHPSMVEAMKANGWTEKQPSKPKTKEVKD